MNRLAIASVITLCLAAHARSQEIPPPGAHAAIQGVNFTDAWTLHVIPPVGAEEDIDMRWVSQEPPGTPDPLAEWHPEKGYYVGKSPRGMTYILDRSGPDGAWAITLSLPQITSYGVCWQLNRFRNEGFIRVISNAPTCNPFGQYFGVTSEDQPSPLEFQMIP